MTINITKSSLEILPSKVTSVSNIVFHMVAISTFNKDNGWCWRHINDNDFFDDVADTPKEDIKQHKKRGELKSIVDKGQAHLLGHKWTHFFFL